MAIWQEDFFILPVKDIKVGDISDFDDGIYWDKFKISKDVFNNISNILKKSKSWSSKIDMYGDFNSNRVEVLYNKSHIIESVSFRIDIMSEYTDILLYIIDFCKEHNFYIFNSKFLLILLSFEHINQYIQECVVRYNSFLKNIEIENRQ